jgi:hypothetical protein
VNPKIETESLAIHVNHVLF